jgi:hypothetical protein
MITGAHAILYSTKAEADRAFLCDVLGLPSVDAGGGWLIFGLPSSEVAVHPDESARHELFLICDDVNVFVGEMTRQGLACTPIQDLRWGRLTQVTLPGGGALGVYEARHARPPVPTVKRLVRRTAKRKAGKRSPRAARKKTRRR